jgi:hypothetical protein
VAFSPASVLTNLGKASTTSRLIGTSLPVIGYMAIGTGATGAARTAAIADTVLSAEVLRVAATLSQQTTTTTNDTFRSVGTFTASTTWAVDEIGLFDASTSGNLFVSSTQGVVTLNSGDSITITSNTQLL